MLTPEERLATLEQFRSETAKHIRPRITSAATKGKVQGLTCNKRFHMTRVAFYLPE